MPQNLSVRGAEQKSLKLLLEN